MISAVFLPTDPEATVFDLTEQIRDGIKRGLRLYTNGRQMALLPKPVKGWALFAVKTNPNNPEVPPCAA